MRAFSFCGTIEYMSPELIKGGTEGHDFSVDWWSVGVLTYELLTGASPFTVDGERNTQAEISKRILKNHPPIPEHLSAEAQDFISKLLIKDPAKRLGGGHSDAAELKAHPFMATVNWRLLAQRKLKAPFRPRIRHELDVSNFADEFTSLAPHELVSNKRVANTANTNNNNPHNTHNNQSLEDDEEFEHWSSSESDWGDDDDDAHDADDQIDKDQAQAGDGQDRARSVELQQHNDNQNLVDLSETNDQSDKSTGNKHVQHESMDTNRRQLQQSYVDQWNCLQPNGPMALTIAHDSGPTSVPQLRGEPPAGDLFDSNQSVMPTKEWNPAINGYGTQNHKGTTPTAPRTRQQASNVISTCQRQPAAFSILNPSETQLSFKLLAEQSNTNGFKRMELLELMRKPPMCRSDDLDSKCTISESSNSSCQRMISTNSNNLDGGHQHNQHHQNHQSHHHQHTKSAEHMITKRNDYHYQQTAYSMENMNLNSSTSVASDVGPQSNHMQAVSAQQLLKDVKHSDLMTKTQSANNMQQYYNGIHYSRLFKGYSYVNPKAIEWFEKKKQHQQEELSASVLEQQSVPEPSLSSRHSSQMNLYSCSGNSHNNDLRIRLLHEDAYDRLIRFGEQQLLPNRVHPERPMNAVRAIPVESGDPGVDVEYSFDNCYPYRTDDRTLTDHSSVGDYTRATSLELGLASGTEQQQRQSDGGHKSVVFTIGDDEDLSTAVRSAAVNKTADINSDKVTIAKRKPSIEILYDKNTKKQKHYSNQNRHHYDNEDKFVNRLVQVNQPDKNNLRFTFKAYYYYCCC